MSWMDNLSHIVERYSGAAGGTASAPADVQQDYTQVAQAAPRETVASSLSNAFHSARTPPFPQMLSQLFGQSNPDQRAGLLSKLFGRQVSPQEAQQVSPQQVQQAAAAAQQQNPGIVDEVSHFYAQHPDVVKALGGLALAMMVQHMVRR